MSDICEVKVVSNDNDSAREEHDSSDKLELLCLELDDGVENPKISAEVKWVTIAAELSKPLPELHLRPLRVLTSVTISELLRTVLTTPGHPPYAADSRSSTDSATWP